jgi:protein phosphatase
MIREINEDSILDLPQRGLWAVADGMGGHAVGDVASRMVIESLSDVSSPSSIEEFVANACAQLQTVNHRLREEAVTRNEQVIGSTVVVLLAHHHHCAYLWAGDSRIYLFRDGRLAQLTRDHSQVEELMALGLLSPGEAANHPAPNIITRAVGAADNLDVDSSVMEVKDGDMFLLCSDGLSNEMSDQEIATALVRGNCQQASAALLNLALQRGGRDNISAIVVRAEDQLK